MSIISQFVNGRKNFSSYCLLFYNISFHKHIKRKRGHQFSLLISHVMLSHCLSIEDKQHRSPR